MDNFSEERIKAIVEAYNIKREREKARYLIIKDSDEFKSKNRERARGHYLLNKDKKKEKYENNKEFLNARSSFYYYRKTDRIQSFKEKFPERVEMLKKSGIDI
tara:strand:+ start:16902 stop:17210 length:309 start_codon:yes stop_codon:yes gene_type:complete